MTPTLPDHLITHQLTTDHLITDLDVLDETLAFNADFEARAAGRPDRGAPMDAATLTALRRNRLAGDAPPVRVPQAQDRTIGAGVGVRLFIPDRIDGGYLHIHGGGWMFGSADGQDERLWSLVVASVEYRLAPEHPFPASLEDCEYAALWFARHAPAEFGTDRLMIGGDSAGAHLSVTSLLRLRDRHGLTGAYRGAHLAFGPYDLAMSPSQRGFGARPLLSNTDSLRRTYATVAPGHGPEQLRDPAISPRYADLSGLPPARMMVGTADPLLDDTLLLAQRWQAMAAPVEVAVVAGAMHGFTLFPLTISTRERRREAEFLMAARDRLPA